MKKIFSTLLKWWSHVTGDNLDFFAKTKNGFLVHLDLNDSHAATHIAEKPELLDLLREVLKNRDVFGERDCFEQDLKRPIGKTNIVETVDSDEIFYAKRLNRDRYTRFVRNREPEITNHITIDLRKNASGSYDLFTVFLGTMTPPFPFDKNDDIRKIKFWNQHALVFTNQDLVEGTEILDCPWA